MKHIYPNRFLMAFLMLFCCFSFSLLAQTQPTPQTLPYTQDFSTLVANAIAYPLGFQGWTTSIAPGSSYNTNATIVADRSLTASSTAATNSGNVHNYDGKIGFQNSSSLDLTISLALETTGKTGITVQYDAMVIRNMYDGTSNTRISEMALQYRVGTTAAFTTLASTAYLSNTTKQITAVTTPVNPQTIKVTLPVECENQSIVQIRWISKQNSGSGGRPSFAIDNISVQNDIIAPINITGFPKIDNVLSNGFDFSTQINEIGKTYYVLLAGGSAKPSVAQIKAGLDANGNSALQADVINITDASLVYTKNIIGLNLNTNYTLYSIAEDTYGNSQADSNQLDVRTANVLVPSINTTISSLELGFSEQNFDSNTLSYQIQASNLSSGVTLTSAGNFTISKDANANFQTSLTFASTDFDANNTPSVYVRFTPNTTGSFTGQITHQSTGASDKIVSLSGIGIYPYVQDFNDVNVLSNSGWTAYSVAGNNIKWTSTSSRFNSSPAAIQINGYTEVGASKDWLISPKLRLDTFSKFPIVSFYSRKFYAGSTLKLMVSVDYDGISSPETATWTPLEGDFPTTTGVFKQSNYINLEGYKTNHTYLAWVYETITNDSNNAAEWTIDDISITNETTFLASNPNLNFGDTAPNTTSVSQSFVFKAGGYGDVTITAPANFELSADNLTFQSNVLVSEAEALLGKTIYARFAPLTKSLSLSGTLTVTATGLNQQIGSFSGSSWPKSETFDIVSYNLEFFGSDVKNTSNVEFGPTDDALQIDNVAKVMNKLNADVYVVQEVSDEPSLDILIQKLNINGKTFDKSISPAWSYSFSTPDPNFPPQKLVVLYNTQTTKVKKSRVMFTELYDNIRAGNTTLANYPGGNSSSFFASGRLPYMVDIETNIAGVKKDITIIDLHARANSGTDISKYNMRKYDVEFLKDSLDVNYPNTNFMILGDYNDDVKASVIAGNPSSYQKLVEDTDRYSALTLDISKAGSYSFLSSGGFLDHIITSNELNDEYVPNSIAVYDPRTDISNYVNTTSDHGPVIARFELKKSEQTIVFDALATKTYGDLPIELTSNSTSNLVVSFSSSDETVVKIIDGKLKIIGAGTASITASQTGNDFYLAAQNVSQSITINKAQLTINADNKTKKYKEVNPELTASYNGFVYEDTAQSLTALPTISTLADANSIAGEYAITIADAISINYSITYVNGKLTVEKLNAFPIVKQAIATQSIIISNQKEFNLLDVFSDADLDVLAYSVDIADGTIADVSLSGTTLTVLAKKAGSTLITVSANDGFGGIVSSSFTANINSNLSTIDFDLSKGFSAMAYPNPANDFVNIAVKSNSENNIQLKLYDINGRLIGSPIEFKGDSNDNIVKIQVGNLQSGFYFYTLSVENKVVFKNKLIIR
ncbi:MBG domain-containing protein [Flavobacterium praedii]|uniref:MBG domain-containing protein n=1 Tax=Flavobacterium praedii TaxID=3002900 RepID=UPI002481D94E|nr:MBG domain-containing protein [Flavobacterium praedii]